MKVLGCLRGPDRQVSPSKDARFQGFSLLRTVAGGAELSAREFHAMGLGERREPVAVWTSLFYGSAHREIIYGQRYPIGGSTMRGSFGKGPGGIGFFSPSELAEAFILWCFISLSAH